MAEGQLFSPREEYVEVNEGELQIAEKIGSGCTAEVFRGFFRGIEVAIKQIEWNKSAQQKADQRAFDREVAIMTKVSHPNLVQLHGISSLTKPLRVVTEYCSGGCCFELLHNREDVELTLQQQVKMCIDVAAAMQYLHAFQPEIIHRDLKSLNLLLATPVENSSTPPYVKVSDFGLARMKDSSASSSDGWGKLTIAAGTCHWMAPEVFQSNSYDNKVDVYSYSMILFEILCREIPFEEEEPANVGRLSLAGQRPDLDAVPPDCPPVLLQLMQMCWAPEPSKRPDFPSIVRVLQSLGMV